MTNKFTASSAYIIIISLFTHSNTVMQYYNGTCIDNNVNHSKTLYNTNN